MRDKTSALLKLIFNWYTFDHFWHGIPNLSVHHGIQERIYTGISISWKRIFEFWVFSREATLGLALSVCPFVCNASSASIKLKHQNQASNSSIQFNRQNEALKSSIIKSLKYCFAAILNKVFWPPSPPQVSIKIKHY